MEVSGQVHALTTYPLGNSPWHPLNRKMGELQSWSAYFREKKKISCRNQTIPGCPKLFIWLALVIF